MATAFCSYHEMIRESGRSFTAALECPRQGGGDAHGRVGVIALAQVEQGAESRRCPRTRAGLKRYLPHARVITTQSWGDTLGRSRV